MFGLMLAMLGAGTALGANWAWDRVGNELRMAYGDGADKPQYATLHLDSGYFRLVPTREAGWGTSVVLTPCFWTGGQLKQGTAVTVGSVTEVGGELLLRLNATETGTAQNYSVRTQVDVTISPPTGDGLIQAHVEAHCTGHVTLDDRPCEAFKPVMLSSMRISDTEWDARAVLRGTEKLAIPANGWLLPPPCQAATRFGFCGGSSDWKQHAPTVEIEWLSTPAPEGVQGWVTPSTDPNDDNLGYWAAFSAFQSRWQYRIRSSIRAVARLGAGTDSLGQSEGGWLESQPPAAADITPGRARGVDRDA
jgi:hypothetical protein